MSEICPKCQLDHYTNYQSSAKNMITALCDGNRKMREENQRNKATLVAAEKRIGELQEGLKKLEWAMNAVGDIGLLHDAVCYGCGGFRPMHFDDCWIDALLKDK